MDKLKYLAIIVIIYLICRVIYSFFYYSESFIDISANLQKLYENLTGTSSPSSTTGSSISGSTTTSGSTTFTPTPTIKPPPILTLSTLPGLLISPSRTININVGTGSGNVTIPCIGTCNNCVISSLTPSGCYVTEKI
jgi:hypothetical protein